MKNRINSRGIISIVSIILVTLIITVITLSLASLTRRGLRQSIDEQLSSQALYAAESGINDALKKIKDTVSPLTSNVDSCDQTGTDPGLVFNSPVLSSNVKYTCVLVDQTPGSIVTDVSTSGVKSYIVEGTSGAINSLAFDWKSADPSATQSFPGCSSATTGCYLSSSGWGSRIGLLRARLIPYVASGLTRANMSNVIDIVAYPGSVGGWSSSMTASSAVRQGNLAGSCASNVCSVTISGLNGGNDTNPGKYYLQLYSYYKDINVTVTGNAGATTFKGAQAVIDATGSASDIVRRVKVTIPLSTSTDFSPFTLNIGNNLCKRFTVNGSGINDKGSTDATCASF